jgi:phosphotransferase system IIB component
MIDAVNSILEEEKKQQQLNEASAFDWKANKNETDPKFTTKKPGERTGHESKKTATGTMYTKKPVKAEVKESFKDRLLALKNAQRQIQNESKTFDELLEDLNDAQVDKIIYEVLAKDADAGDYIHDFIHSKNPKFAGKSKEMRKKMALGAYYSKKNEDFELHPEAGKVLKHIKPEHQAKYKPDLAKSVYKGDYADRTAVLKAAKAAGHLNEEVEIVYEANIEPTSAKSRSHISNLSNPTVNGVTHKGKEIGLITKQPSGEYHAHHSAAKLAHAQSGTFDSKDKAHQFIRNAHAQAIKSGTLSDKFSKANEEVELHEESMKDCYDCGVREAKKEMKTGIARKSKYEKGTPEYKESLRGYKSVMKNEEVEGVDEALIGGQKKIDKNHNGKIDAQDFQILRGQKKSQKNEGVMDVVKKAGTKALHVLGHGSDEDMKKDLQKKMGISQKDVTTDTLAGRVQGGAPNQHSSHKVKLKAESAEKPPFDPPYRTVKSKDHNVKDKSGAVHTPMSHAKHLAKMAMKKVKNEMIGKTGTSE